MKLYTYILSWKYNPNQGKDSQFCKKEMISAVALCNIQPTNIY